MSDVLTPAQQRQEEAKQPLADLLELTEGLSNWEVNFIESLSHWNGGFTYKQRVTIAKIWDEKVNR